MKWFEVDKFEYYASPSALTAVSMILFAWVETNRYMVRGMPVRAQQLCDCHTKLRLVACTSSHAPCYQPACCMPKHNTRHAFSSCC